MMTRKHNAAVKAQQKAERDKLRGQMRCVRLHCRGLLWAGFGSCEGCSCCVQLCYMLPS